MNSFKVCIHHSGKGTEHYARALHKVETPCTVVMTLRKNKTLLPSLKPNVDIKEVVLFIKDNVQAVSPCRTNI